MSLLRGSDLGEGRGALEEWAKPEDCSSQGGGMDAAWQWSSGAHLSQVRAEVYFQNVLIPVLS